MKIEPWQNLPQFKSTVSGSSRPTMKVDRKANEGDRDGHEPFDETPQLKRAFEVNIEIKSDRVWFMVHRMNLPSPARECGGEGGLGYETKIEG